MNTHPFPSDSPMKRWLNESIFSFLPLATKKKLLHGIKIDSLLRLPFRKRFFSLTFQIKQPKIDLHRVCVSIGWNYCGFAAINIKYCWANEWAPVYTRSISSSTRARFNTLGKIYDSSTVSEYEIWHCFRFNPESIIVNFNVSAFDAWNKKTSTYSNWALVAFGTL